MTVSAAAFLGFKDPSLKAKASVELLARKGIKSLTAENIQAIFNYVLSAEFQDVFIKAAVGWHRSSNPSLVRTIVWAKDSENHLTGLQILLNKKKIDPKTRKPTCDLWYKQGGYKIWTQTFDLLRGLIKASGTMKTSKDRSLEQIRRELSYYQKYSPYDSFCKIEGALEYPDKKHPGHFKIRLISIFCPYTLHTFKILPSNISNQMIVILHICIAVNQMHKRGDAHLDIKPANCLIDFNGRSCLQDFGATVTFKGPESLTALNQEELTKALTTFPSPEQARIMEQTRSSYHEAFKGLTKELWATDIWNIGIMARKYLIDLPESSGPYHYKVSERMRELDYAKSCESLSALTPDWFSKEAKEKRLFAPPSYLELINQMLDPLPSRRPTAKRCVMQIMAYHQELNRLPEPEAPLAASGGAGTSSSPVSGVKRSTGSPHEDSEAKRTRAE